MNDEQQRLNKAKKEIEFIFDNRYSVKAPLGKGGMGEVYLVGSNDGTSLERAIKIIPKGRHPGQDIYAEIEALKKISSPGVPHIIEIKQNDDAVFIVQQYVKGKSLLKIVEENGKVPDETALLWMADVAKIIADVHREGFLHLDIKPDNIMIQENGRAQLIDFGVAQKIGERSTVHGLFGARRYTAPERLRGEPSDVRSDVFGYGATFYFVVTGKRPPKILPDDQTPIITMKRELERVQSPVIRLVLQNCISFNPDRRHQNFQDIYLALCQREQYVQALNNVEKKRKLRFYRIIALFAAGAVLIAGGFIQMNTARNNTYKSLISQGDAYVADNRLNKAKRCYQSAIKLKKNEAAGYQGLYETYTEKEEYDKVISGIETLFNNNSHLNESAELHYLLGNAYYEKGKYSLAESQLHEAIQIKPMLEEHLVLGLTYCAEGEYDKAQDVIQDLRKAGDNTDGADYLSGQISAKQDDQAAAISSFKQVINETKNQNLKQRAILSLAKLYRDRKSYDDEIDVLESAQRDDAFANNIAIRELLGEAYYYAAENGSAAYYQKAVAQYRALLDSGFSSVTTYRNLAVCYQEAGNYSQAETTLNQMIAAYPDDYNGYMLRCFLILKEEENKPQDDRDYSRFETNYNRMMQRAGSEQDSNIAVLEARYEELQEDGWL